MARRRTGQPKGPAAPNTEDVDLSPGGVAIPRASQTGGHILPVGGSSGDGLWDRINNLASQDYIDSLEASIKSREFMDQYRPSGKVTDLVSAITSASKLMLELSGYKFPHENQYYNYMQTILGGAGSEEWKKLEDAFLKKTGPKVDEISRIFTQALTADFYRAELNTAVATFTHQSKEVRESICKKIVAQLPPGADYSKIGENPRQAINDLLTVRNICEKYHV